MAGSGRRSELRQDPAIERRELGRGDTEARSKVPFSEQSQNHARAPFSRPGRGLRSGAFEYRNFGYSDGSSSHETRFRNRIAIKVALNHAELSRDNTLYWMADFEFFAPLSEDVPERFATKRRTRTGLGFRGSDRWRFEVLYMRDGARDTLDAEFDTVANIVNVKLKIIL